MSAPGAGGRLPPTADLLDRLEVLEAAPPHSATTQANGMPVDLDVDQMSVEDLRVYAKQLQQQQLKQQVRVRLAA